MARFRFRLQTLLRMAEMARDERRAELAQAYRAEEKLRDEARRLSGELDDLARTCRATASPGMLNVDRLLDVRRYEMVLRAHREQLTRQAALVGEEVERRRQAVVEATREVRLLEQLRERQRARHTADEQLRETKELDEAAGRTWRPAEETPLPAAPEEVR